MIITDGTGTGISARVNGGFRLRVESASHSDEHEAATSGDSYILLSTTTANTLTLATGNTYNIVYMENSSSNQNMVIQAVAYSSNTAGVLVPLIKNQILGTVGANNAEIPPNGNFFSGKTADGVFHSWDETGTVGITGLTGGTTIGINTTSVGSRALVIAGSLILGQGNSLTVQAVNDTGGNVEIALLVRFFFEEVL